MTRSRRGRGAACPPASPQRKNTPPAAPKPPPRGNPPGPRESRLRLAAAPGLEWRPGTAVTVGVAADGYPGNPVKGDEITIAGSDRPGAYLLHAGTSQARDGSLRSAGGRVLNAVGSGPDLAAARAAA